MSAYIERCVQSVIRQTYHDIECIIVDDASQDDSIEKCNKVIRGEWQNNSGISFQIIQHERNKGLSAARNTGVEAASGEYIYFLDGDDEITNDCIEKLVIPIKKDSSIEIVMGNFCRFEDGLAISSSERRTLVLNEDNIVSNKAVRDLYFTKGIYQSAWNKLIKRDFIIQHQLIFPEGFYWEDTLWTFFIVKYLNHLYTIPDITYHYVKRPNAITTGMVDKKEKRRHWCRVYDEIANHFTEGEEGREAKYHMKRFCYLGIDNPDNDEFLHVSRKYRTALANNHYLMSYFFLSLIIFLSRFSWGRTLFYFFADKLKNMKFQCIC